MGREFGWTLDDIRQLRPSELISILKELERQKTVYEYAEFKSKWAFLAAVITNGLLAIAGMFSKRKPKTVEPDDFINKDWRKKIEGMFKEAHKQQNNSEWASLIADAKAKGLKGPWN